MTVRLGQVASGSVFALLALGMGFGAANHLLLATAVAVVPLLVLLVAQPRWCVPLAVALLPYTFDVARGHAGSLQISPSDIFIGLSLAGITIALLTGRAVVDLSVLKPVALALLLYFSCLLIAWSARPSVSGLATIAQRGELLVVAMVLGVFLFQSGQLMTGVNLYLVVASVFAAAAIVTTLIQGQAPVGFLGVQKNPVGSAIASALLLVFVLRDLRFRPALGVLLALGLLATLSRGAILSVMVAIVVVTLLQSSGRRARAILLLPVVGVVLYGAYVVLPSEQQVRLTSAGSSTDYASQERVDYAGDAIAKFKSAPILGTGVGPYASGSFEEGTFTDDPHDVVLLEAAEGGVVLAGGFLFLVLRSVGALITRVRRNPIVMAALAIQVASVLHGLVDVYWVRGTPVLGWLMIGAALAAAAAAKAPDESEILEPVRRQSSASAPRAGLAAG